LTTAVVIFTLLLICYATTLCVLARGFIKMPPFKGAPASPVPVTIIIPARNEQQHLSRCLKSIIEQDYPRQYIQIVVINDASTDSTALVADTTLEDAGIDYRVLSSPMRKGKKDSISTAVKFARHDFIILRDADTYTASPNWLNDMCSMYAQRSGLVIGPVAVERGKGILGAIQSLETGILALVTGGSAFYKKPFLCSGANLGFTKDIFQRTGGYQSHSHLVSGDDVFFLEDVKKLGDVPVNFLKSKDSIVITYPLKSAREVLMQRSRWASKFRYNSNVMNLWLAFLVFAANVAFVLALLGMFIKPEMRTYSGLYVLAKLSVDVFLLSLASGFIKSRVPLIQGIPAALVYPLYACAVAMLSIFIKPVWKEE
jgi:biofilm PGA synthesis N-glycosyltransferase PgaC